MRSAGLKTLHFVSPSFWAWRPEKLLKLKAAADHVLTPPLDAPAPAAQTMAVTTVIMFQVFYVLNCRSLNDSLLSIGLWSNMTVFIGIAALLLLQLGFIYLPVMNAIFGSLPLSAKDLLVATAVGMIILPVIGVEKMLRNRLEARPA